jgi:hypothetical protein
MRKRLLWLVGMAFFASTAWSGEAPPPTTWADTAEKIRAGEIDVGKKYGVAVDGRFHVVHLEILGMGCLACHENRAFPEDAYFLRRAEFPLRGHPGAVDPIACISCHRNEGIASTWYGVPANDGAVRLNRGGEK